MQALIPVTPFVFAIQYQDVVNLAVGISIVHGIAIMIAPAALKW